MIMFPAQYTPDFCETRVLFPTLPAVSPIAPPTSRRTFPTGNNIQPVGVHEREKTKRIQNSIVRRIAPSPCLDLRSGFNREGCARIGWFLILAAKSAIS